MRFGIFLLFAIIYLTPIKGLGQESTLYNGKVDIKQNSVEVRDGFVFFDADISIYGIEVGRYQSLILTPWIQTEVDSVALKPVILYGSNKYKIYSRSVKLNKSKKEKDENHTIYKNYPKSIQEMSYKDTISYQPWMGKAGLSLTGTFCTYGGTPINTYSHILIDDLKLRE